MWGLALLLLLLAAATAAAAAEEDHLCGITCFFNPLRHASRTINYYQARQWSLRQGLFLTVVELAFGTDEAAAKFEIESDDDLTRVIRLQTSRDNIMWHKEALLNAALQSLPPRCTAVVWLDSDVVLEDGWIAKTLEMLRRHSIGQPFSKLVRLPRGIFSPHSYWSALRERRLGLGHKEGQMHHSAAAAAVSGRGGGGHTGFAWAARRSLLDKVRFYDKAIVGGFDYLLVSALSSSRGGGESRMNAAMQLDFDQWAELARSHFLQEGDGAALLGSPSSMVRAAAFWHGELKHRNYSQRHAILLNNGYDPAQHVIVDADGALRWHPTAAPTQLRQDVLDMFINRREDGGGGGATPPVADEL